MNSRLKIAAVIVVASAAAFASSLLIWPPPAFFAPPPSLMPFFVGLGIAESLAFGCGVAFLIFGIEIDVKLRQGAGGHVGHMNVSQTALANLRDISAVLFNPFAVKQVALRRAVNRAHHDIALLRAVSR